MARKKIVEENMTEEIKNIENDVKKEVKEEPVAAKAKGVVVKCDALNVRKAPNPKAEIVGRLMKGSEVDIDLRDSTGNYYAISTSPKFGGFCVKDYIEVK